jgi:hypothetical protein
VLEVKEHVGLEGLQDLLEGDSGPDANDLNRPPDSDSSNRVASRASSRADSAFRSHFCASCGRS